MEQPKIHTFQFKGRRGIDDLMSIYAFYGNSQGDESHSNEISDYINSKGWMSFGFEGVDVTDQTAIYMESARRARWNRDYIEMLHKEGKYGEEYTNTVQMVHNEALDGPFEKPTSDLPLHTFRSTTLDFSKDEPEG